MSVSLYCSVRDALATVDLDLGPVAVIEEPDRRWVSGARLLDGADPTVLATVDRVAEFRGTTDRSVAAALFWKAYAAQVATRVVLPWMTAGATVDGSLSRLAWDVERGVLPRLAFIELESCSNADSVRGDDVAEMLRCLLFDHFTPLSNRIREELPLGARTFHGLAVAAILAVAANNSAGPPQARLDLVDRLVDALPSPFRRFALVAELRPRGDDWRPYPLRPTCCLAYKVGTGRYCSTCNLLSTNERTEQLSDAGYQWRFRPTHKGNQ